MKTALTLALVNILFGLGYPIVKAILGRFDPGEWVFMRVAGTGLLLLLLFPRQIFKTVTTGTPLLWLFVASIFGIIVNQICFVEGLDRSIPAHSAMINATIPLQTLLLSRFLGHEKMSRAKIGGILLGLSGIAILLHLDKGFSGDPFLMGDFLTIVNTVSYSIFLVITRKKLSDVSPMTSLTWVTLFGILGTGLYAGWELPVSEFPTLPLQMWLFIAYIITFQSIVTYYFSFWALRRTHATHVAMYVYLQPLVATLVAYFFLGDTPTPRFFVSAVLILIGLVLGGVR